MASEEARFLAWLCKRPGISKKTIENMTRVLLGLPAWEETADGGKGSGNFGHLGNPGNVGGSGPCGSYRESGKANCTQALRNELLHRRKQYTNVTNGVFGDDQTHAVSGFKKDKRASHNSKHAAFMGFLNKKGEPDERKYESAGIDFMSRGLDEWTEEILTKGGDRVRFSHMDQVFGIVSADNELTTFFDPKGNGADPEDDWEGRLEKYGKRK